VKNIYFRIVKCNDGLYWIQRNLLPFLGLELWIMNKNRGNMLYCSNGYRDLDWAKRDMKFFLGILLEVKNYIPFKRKVLEIVEC
jgi:hypothetical protein